MDSTEDLEINPTPSTYKILSERTSIVFILISLVLMVVGSVIFIIFGSWQFSAILDEAKVGQFGDFIGGVIGPILSFVGIVLFYVALTEQRKDMKINQSTLSLQVTALNQQIIEFAAQREELESTRKIYEQQTKTMRVQQFDSSFYSLLNVFIQLKINLNINTGDYFLDKYVELVGQVDVKEDDSLLQIISKTNDAYTQIFLNNRSLLSHYFKTLYRLLRVISDCDDFSSKEQEFYSKIVRSQITDNELIVLYYNVRSIYGQDARPIMLKFDMLKHIRSLSKIEFKKITFGSENQKITLTVFNEWLANLININLVKAADIESVDIRVEEEYNQLNIIVGIYIDNDFRLTIFVDNENLPQLPFSEQIFLEFVQLLLYDILFLNKLRSFTSDDIKKSITKEDRKKLFNYSIPTLQ